MYNFCAGLGRMRSGDVCMWILVCGDMCVRGDWETDECKQFSRLTVYEKVGYEWKCWDACKCVSMNILEIVYKINMCLR